MGILKLDLHMHPEEMSSFEPVSVTVVKRVLDSAVDHGLDGIAVTEHENLVYGQRFVQIVNDHFQHYPLIVLYGQEIKVGYHEIVEINLPRAGIFRFLAHPATFIELNNTIMGIEIENGMHYVSRRHVNEMLEITPGLLTLHNSDAHHFEDIGTVYNELTWEDLVSRVR
ncbi:MAG: hypothetical protein WA113_05175 [Desulfitobacteriaceae bacterium]